MATYQTFTDRELLERVAYLGPAKGAGGGCSLGYDWEGAVTAAAVWTPQTDNRFIVSAISINTSGACTVTIFDQIDDTEHRIFKGALAANANVVIPFPIPFVAGEVGNILKITTSATGGFLNIWGWESGTAYSTTSISTSSSSSSSSSSTTSVTTISTSSSSVSTTTISTSSSSYSSSSSSVSTTTISVSSSSSSTQSTSSSSHTMSEGGL